MLHFQSYFQNSYISTDFRCTSVKIWENWPIQIDTLAMCGEKNFLVGRKQTPCKNWIERCYSLSLFSFDVAWLGQRLTASCTCSGFMKMGILRMTQPAGGCRTHLNRTGHVVAMRTYSFLRRSEYWNTQVRYWFITLLGNVFGRACV